MTEDSNESVRNYRLSARAFEYERIREQTISNKKMDTFLKGLTNLELKEKDVMLPIDIDSDTFIVLFPKDSNEKSFNDFSLCDVLVYNSDGEFFKVKTNENGVSVLRNLDGIATTSMICDGGFFFSIKESSTLEIDHKPTGSHLYLLKEGRKFDQEFTIEEIEDFLENPEKYRY
jgi:hypothetical protein